MFGDILQSLGLANLFAPSIGAGAAANPAREGVPEMGGASVPKVGTSADESRMANPQRTALNNSMMQLLMASMLAQPAVPPQAPAGGPSPPKASGQAFAYSPTSAMAIGPRGRL